MKTTTVSIKIPKPCGEDWNSMGPDTQGRFCKSCSKSVIDFSAMTVPEIFAVLNSRKEEKVCGRFMNTQLNHSVQISIHPDTFQPNLPVQRKIMLAIFIVFGSLLFSCEDEHGKPIKDLRIELTSTEPALKGEVMMTDSINNENFFSGDIKTTLGDTIIQDLRNAKTCATTQSFLPLSVTDELYYTAGAPMLDFDEYNEIDPPKTTAVINSSVSLNHQSSDQENSANDQNETNENEIFLFPNPANSNVTIHYSLKDDSDYLISLYDETGSYIRRIASEKNRSIGVVDVTFDVQGLPAGFYTVSLISNGKRFDKKLVVHR